MARRHFSDLNNNPTNNWHNYGETPRGKIEQKVELFCEKLKYAFLYKLRSKKRGEITSVAKKRRQEPSGRS